jgi:PAS domain S-box-containing protein
MGRDTEQKQVEMALRESEEKFRSLVENISDWVWEVDQNGIYTYVSPKVIELLGYKPEEVIGKNPFDFMPEQEVKRVSEIFQKIVESREPFSGLENINLHKDGRCIVLETSGVPIFNAAGNFLGYRGIDRDIAERKRAEEIIKAEKEKFETYIESMADGLCVNDAKGTIVQVNKAFAKMFGYKSPEEVVGMGISHNVAGASQLSMTARFIETVKNKEPEIMDFEVICLRQNGSEFPVSFNIRNLWEKDEYVGSITVARDITERKRVEEMLRESEEKHRILYESSRDAIMTLEPPDWRFTSGNPATIKMFRAKDEAEFTSKGPWELSPECQPDGMLSSDKAKEIIERAIKDGSNFFEWMHKRLNGEDFPATVLLTRFEWKGQMVLQATVRDIAEQKKLEEQLNQARRMETVGRLAGGIAHDFNNILAVIISYAGFIFEDLKENDPMKQDVQEIKDAAHRAATLTKQLLAFSSKQVLQPVSLDLNRVLSEIEKMLRRVPGEDIDLVLVLAPNIGKIRADPSQIEQVLMNIVVNSRDAMLKGGKLTIETSNVEIGKDHAASHIDIKPGSYVQIAITDTGCGMDKQTKAKIFEPFFTTKEFGKGTGLGLATAYGIVKQSGGNLLVYSEPDKGTTFRIYLPQELATIATGTISPTVPRRTRGTETILLVEDEEPVRKATKRILDAVGYVVLTAANGGEALLICEQHQAEIHLVLTDVIMPQMSGKILIDLLMKVRPNIKVIYMSGYTRDTMSLHGILDPKTNFIGKPFNAEDLERKVRKVLDAPSEGSGKQQ